MDTSPPVVTHALLAVMYAGLSLQTALDGRPLAALFWYALALAWALLAARYEQIDSRRAAAAAEAEAKAPPVVAIEVRGHGTLSPEEVAHIFLAAPGMLGALEHFIDAHATGGDLDDAAAHAQAALRLARTGPAPQAPVTLH